jgi:hypothetical protein
VRVTKVDDRAGANVLYEAEEGNDLFVKGWTSGGALVVLRAWASPEMVYLVEVLTVDMSGAARSLGTLEDIRPGNAYFDPVRERLYVTTNDGGISNIAAFDTRSGRLETLTDNPFPGVLFFGFQSMADGTIVHAKQERNRDIWLVDYR